MPDSAQGNDSNERGGRFSRRSTTELLASFAAIMRELRRRGVVRSSNNPVADYAEKLVADALRLRLAPNSTTGYDATDSKERRYEIKGRRITRRGKTTQFGAIRGLNRNHFDLMAGVLFAEDFRVDRAYLIPHKVVARHAVYRRHVNAWILKFRDALWKAPGVVDITARVRRAQQSEGT